MDYFGSLQLMRELDELKKRMTRIEDILDDMFSKEAIFEEEDKDDDVDDVDDIVKEKKR